MPFVIFLRSATRQSYFNLNKYIIRLVGMESCNLCNSDLVVSI